MSDFENMGLKAGQWSGVLRRETPPRRVALTHMGAEVAEADVTAAGDAAWRVEVGIPAALLSDGIHSFALLAEEGDEETPATETLATLSLVAGKPLEADLRAELDLLRAEMELLKREFRRLATQD